MMALLPPLLALVTLLPAVPAPPPVVPARPNLLLFLVDDMGYGDLSCFGGSEVVTTQIDRMAAEGLKLTTFYSAAPVCTPSRAGLLLGLLPKRTGFCGPGVMWCNSLSGIQANETTWAAALQRHSYQTLMVGKWHVGHTPGHRPTDHGFGEFLGVPYSQDIGYTTGNTTAGHSCDVAHCGNASFGCYPLPLLRNERIVQQPVNLTTLTPRYTAEVLRFLTTAAAPWAVYYAFDHVHTPQFGLPAAGHVASPRGPFGDALLQVDTAVGAVLAKVHQQQQQPISDSGGSGSATSTQTLALLTSDNGAPSSGSLISGMNSPFTGTKFQTWEGGVRMPAIAWWPGVIRGGATTTALASTLDIYATFLELAGIAGADDAPVSPDSHSLVPLLLDPAGGGERHSSRQAVFIYNGCTLYAVRLGPWKAHYVTQPPQGMVGAASCHDKNAIQHGRHAVPILYHIPTDPGERFPVVLNASTDPVSLSVDAAGVPWRAELSVAEVQTVLGCFNRTVEAHLVSLGDWVAPSRTEPNDWSARLCCNASTLPRPCFCDVEPFTGSVDEAAAATVDQEGVHAWQAPAAKSDDGMAATAVLTHATQKILQHQAAPAGGPTPLALMAAQNEYEPLLVVLTGAQTVSGVQCTLVAGGRPLPTAIYRLGYVSVVNITDCESINGPDEYPDPLIPDIDAFVQEKRNAFPLSVPAGENRQVLVDLFVPPDTTPGSYSGFVTVTASSR